MGESFAVVGFIAIILVLLFAMLVRICMKLPPAKPYRRALNRKIRPNGDEEIELDCGHWIAIIRHRSGSYPCKECAETASSREG